MDTKDWFLVLGPLVGIFLGGSINSAAKWIELKHQTHREERKEIIEHFEELHQLVNNLVPQIERFKNDVDDLSRSMLMGKEKEKVYRAFPLNEDTISRINSLQRLWIPETRAECFAIFRGHEKVRTEGWRFVATGESAEFNYQADNLTGLINIFVSKIEGIWCQRLGIPWVNMPSTHELLLREYGITVPIPPQK